MLNHQTLILLFDPHMWTLTTKKLGQQRIYIYTIYIYVLYIYILYIYYIYTIIHILYIYIHDYVTIVDSVLICHTFDSTNKNSSLATKVPQRHPGAIILDVADGQIRDPGEVVLQTSTHFEAARPTMGNGIRNYKYKLYYITIDIIYMCVCTYYVYLYIHII